MTEDELSKIAEKTNILETSPNDLLLAVRYALNKYFAYLR